MVTQCVRSRGSIQHTMPTSPCADVCAGLFPNTITIISTYMALPSATEHGYEQNTLPLILSYTYSLISSYPCLVGMQCVRENVRTSQRADPRHVISITVSSRYSRKHGNEEMSTHVGDISHTVCENGR